MHQPPTVDAKCPSRVPKVRDFREAVTSSSSSVAQHEAVWPGCIEMSAEIFQVPEPTEGAIFEHSKDSEIETALPAANTSNSSNIHETQVTGVYEKVLSHTRDLTKHKQPLKTYTRK